MLEEHEWEQIYPSMTGHIDKVKRIRSEDGCDLKTAQSLAGTEACDKYFELTGYKETNYLAIWHHRLIDFGDECPQCGHLFRTPKAKFCANCGYKK